MTDKTNFYRLSVDQTRQQLNAQSPDGLSASEAAERLAHDGHNEFAKKKHTSTIVKFLNQFKSFMILVLIAAAVISGVVGVMNGEGMADTFIILAIVVINAIIGVLQENKAEKSLDALERMSAPHCKVMRDGEVQVIESRDLVVGDTVVIETGDSVPADLRLTEATNLKIQEAALTGESLPVEKNTDTLTEEVGIGDRTNMAFASCSVTYGHGVGIVTATATATEVGKIASMIQSVPEVKTPMQQRLDQLGKFLAIAALVICALIFVIGIAYGNDILTMFMTAVSLAAAAIPEGLPAVSTIVLAMGVTRLAKRNAIVRNLPSVETLGSTSVICSDKTGTLTQNRMTVVATYTEGSQREASELTPAIKTLIRIAALANDGKLNSEDGSTVGDPTETALLDLGRLHGIDKNELDATSPRTAEIPFDSERKLMTTIHPEGEALLVATKGGMDELLARCNRILDAGAVRPLTDADRESLRTANTSLAGQALRVLAMAYNEIQTLPAEVSSATIERDLVFVGMVGMIDPPREEVKAAVAECRAAGIRPVMITGDHLITASAIARQLGIMADGDIAVMGAEVEKMSDADLRTTAQRAAVFARVAPEHKVRIVKAFQSLGNVVAMTGDGVNDAPALKLADIGVAMGITGTDVSKEASDVVLADDNFATIVSAVREGRRIYDNLMKSIQFMLSTNLGEILVLFVAVICNLVSPLLPIHILWINLVTDSLPALALSFDPADDDIMKRKPIDSKQGIMTRGFSLRVLLQGACIAGLSLAAYHIGLQTSVDAARTMTFATLALSQMTLIFSIRSGMHAAVRGMFRNKFLWGAILFVVALMALVLLIPAVQSVFHVVSLTGTQWLWVGGLSLGAVILGEMLKGIIRLFRK
ncbi:MAG: calcium-translocating P-type ATPase, PMCA-type [Rikenellaceae bacterium]|nr:calcium-translocating P-type ATPase, PMCA-type [Rikenellaceae bacterium]